MFLQDICGHLRWDAATSPFSDVAVPPRKLSKANPKEGNFIFQPSIFRGHVIVLGSILASCNKPLEGSI